ncbi:hypothetical protein SAMN05421805_12357 [Saccharopolyspora antimicrobica]|uniref:Uncharacterized protein n=1 Tax=Saccharopolyspora antimicrobica TaxID=455193 RepID=A0A1I5JNT9_9PSEU|nr:hypothetical protein [Saccharopolyspora antimicrobica]RKT84690.1 hypothetical protein ATL45_3014 [Saccharopolyspora antimicrobica]SFO74016.1 hypothetical protein SAMN05421805_12357 [Saccharopolyspora antimicrobica]
MSEELLRESLRAAVADEPPLGIDPDAVAAEGKRRQRRRRAVIGAAVATLVVAAGAAALPGVLGPRAVPPATPRVDAVEPISWPPAGMVRVELPEPQLIARGEQIELHLAESMSRTVPGARDISTEQQHGLGPGFGTEPPATVTVRAGFRRAVAQGSVLPVLVDVAVLGPGTVLAPPDQACGDGQPATRHCEQHVLADGSIAVDSSLGLPSAAGASHHVVRHFRVDGTVVSVTASFDTSTAHPDGISPASGLAQPPMDLAELIALATDPQLSLSR